MFTLTEDTKRQAAREACLQSLRELRAGIVLDASAGKKRIFALLEHGAPGRNIPPRPVIRPALARESAREGAAAGLRQAMAAAREGSMEGVSEGLAAAGAAGAEAIRAYIDAGVPPPNAPPTVARKGFNQPLVDTGELYSAFTYSIRKK